MELNSEQMASVLSDLKQKQMADIPCNFCGPDDWEVRPDTYLMPGHNGTNSVWKTKAIVLIAIRCITCSQMHFFDASQMAVFPPISSLS